MSIHPVGVVLLLEVIPLALPATRVLPNVVGTANALNKSYDDSPLANQSKLIS